MSIRLTTRCEFCRAPDPHWAWETENFVWPDGKRETDPWIACDTCDALIQADDEEGLGERCRAQVGVAVQMAREKDVAPHVSDKELRAEFAEAADEVVTLFMAAKTGVRYERRIDLDMQPLVNGALRRRAAG